MRPCAPLELSASVRGRHRLAIGAGGRHRAVGVACGDDPRLDRDVLATEAVRIAATVPALVRGADDAADLTHKTADLLEHPLALDRVGLDDRPLPLVELPGLVDDLLGNGDLADVVQESAELDVSLQIR